MAFIVTTYIEHLFKFSWVLSIEVLSPDDQILCFCRRIASECMMASVCLCVVSLYLNSGSLVISANRIVNTGH